MTQPDFFLTRVLEILINHPKTKIPDNPSVRDLTAVIYLIKTTSSNEDKWIFYKAIQLAIEEIKEMDEEQKQEWKSDAMGKF